MVNKMVKGNIFSKMELIVKAYGRMDLELNG